MTSLSRWSVAWRRTLREPETPLATLLPRFADCLESVLALGVAEPVDATRCRVRHVAGPYAEPLHGYTFARGEGYFGQVLATGQPGYWADLAEDPRSAWFRQQAIPAAAILCYPLEHGPAAAGMLFAVFAAPVNPETRVLLDGLAVVIHRTVWAEGLEMRLRVRTLRLAALIELIQALHVVQDPTNVWYLLLDMSLTLVQGRFACLAYRPRRPPNSLVTLLSRGLARPAARDYGRTLVATYLEEPLPDFADGSWPVLRRRDDTPVIEHPVFVHGQAVAVLAVAVDAAAPREMDDLRQLVSVLTLIGGGALERIQADHGPDWHRTVTALHHATAVWDPAAHERAERLHALVQAFAATMELSDSVRTALESAALLTPYEAPQVRAVAPDVADTALAALRDYHQVLTGRPGPLGQAGQILALAHDHLGLSPVSLPPLDPVLREQFHQFYVRHHVEQQQIAGLSMPTPDAREDAALPVLEPLTPREEEVLASLLAGQSNREIARHLVVSEHTIKNHLTHIFQKLGVSDRAQAIALVLGRAHSSPNAREKPLA
jgi:DNA-binding CsgD family transcriptional regulator